MHIDPLTTSIGALVPHLGVVGFPPDGAPIDLLQALTPDDSLDSFDYEPIQLDVDGRPRARRVTDLHRIQLTPRMSVVVARTRIRSYSQPRDGRYGS